MLEAKMCSKIISYGKNRYKFTVSDFKWQVMMWGWWPNGGNLPAWKWMPISESKVPDKVKQAV